VLTGIVVGAVVAIVSALVTYIAGLKMQRERWRREDQLASRNNAHEVKRAARLIDAELGRAQAAAQISVNEKRWWSSDVQLTTEAWENHRGIIAPELSDADWQAVLIAVLRAEFLITVRSGQTVDINAAIAESPAEETTEGFAEKLAEKLTPALSERTVELIVLHLGDIEAGRRSLASHMRDTPPTSGNAANP
jgi:hypothetical protein